MVDSYPTFQFSAAKWCQFMVIKEKGSLPDSRHFNHQEVMATREKEYPATQEKEDYDTQEEDPTAQKDQATQEKKGYDTQEEDPATQKDQATQEKED